MSPQLSLCPYPPEDSLFSTVIFVQIIAGELFRSEAKLYRNKMADAYDTEDFISIGYILVWDITKKQNFSEEIDGGQSSFGGYLKQAVRWRYSKLFTDYSLI